MVSSGSVIHWRPRLLTALIVPIVAAAVKTTGRLHAPLHAASRLAAPHFVAGLLAVGVDWQVNCQLTELNFYELVPSGSAVRATSSSGGSDRAD